MKTLKNILLAAMLIVPQFHCDYADRMNENDPKADNYLASGIVVKQAGTPIANGGLFNGGSTQVLTEKDLVFTIENNGRGDLLLTGNPRITIDNDTAENYEIIVQPDARIERGASTGFTVRFAPSSLGALSAVLQIPCDDADNKNFSFSVITESTAAPAPEINIKRGTTDILSSPDSVVDFGSAVQSSETQDITFTIENSGDADLTITEFPARVNISGTNLNQFSVISEPALTVNSGSTTTFTIRFEPTSIGTKTATVKIYHDDASGNENPYTFTITGTGSATPIPEINIKRGTTDVPSGTTTPVLFGSAVENSGIIDLVFTIENSGSANLTISENPSRVNISGTNANQFSIQSNPALTINQNSNTTFSIRFQPTSTGEKNANISISNNDSDENPYTFPIRGTGTATPVPEIEIIQVADGGSFGMGSTKQTTTLDSTFTITNSGAANLNLSLSGNPLNYVTLSGTNASLFSVTAQPNSPISASGSTTFTIRFNPGNAAAGTKTATVTIMNDDASESTYDFTLTATCVEWSGSKALDSTASNYSTSVYTLGTTTGLCYTDSNGDLIFARSVDSGATFTTYTVDNGVDCQYCSITALDTNPTGDETVYISYYDATNGDLEFAKSGSYTSWTKLSVDETGDVGQYSSISIINFSTSSRLFISYYDTTNGNLKFARSSNWGTSFTVTSIDSSSNNVGQWTSISSGVYNFSPIAFDVHVSYYDATSLDLKYMKSTDSGVNWSTPVTIDSTGDVGKYSSLVSFGSNVYIAYADSTNYDARIAIYRGSWSTDTIQTANNSNGHISLAIDSNEELYVAYRRPNTNSSLYYATSSNYGADWTETQVLFSSSPNAIGYFNDIAVNGDRVYITSIGYISGYLLEFSKSIDGGVTW